MHNGIDKHNGRVYINSIDKDRDLRERKPEYRKKGRLARNNPPTT